MKSEITYWCPKTSSLAAEEIYGEKWLRFSYENFFGKIGLWAVVKRAWFSRWYGRKMDKPESKKKIIPFIEKYGLDCSEFLQEPTSFTSFNQFFYRQLKPESRPIFPGEKVVVFPADGRHFLIPDLSQTQYIYAKGQCFELKSLLGCHRLANQFESGSALISRLCPVDYHRFHFPVSGKSGIPKLINGDLLSVNPIALRKKISIFWQNKRYIHILQNEHLGDMIQLLVGATCVGSVHFTAKEDSWISKGEECGYFSFGGSCVISIFPKNKIRFNDQLLENSSKGHETYFKMGEYLGGFSN